MDAYIIAVKREKRASTPPTWLDELKAIDNLTLRGEANPLRVHVEATPEAIEEARRRIGDFCLIEPVILHHTC